MKIATFLATMSIFLLIMAVSAYGLPDYGQIYTASQANDQDPSDRVYSSATPSGAPSPITPSSPDSLGLQIPSESASFSYTQEPPSGETTQGLIPASRASVAQLTRDVQSAEYNYPSQYNYPPQYNDPSQSSMTISKGIGAKNRLYASSVPQTVASCRLYGWQPMWLQTSGSGPIWFYEWYPSGELTVNYLGVSSAGWQKKWFNGDTPGWHILQFYRQGWSNYIYIYVYGTVSGPGHWTDLGPKNSAASIPIPSRPGLSAVTLRSSWFKGYDVYLDGEYVGREGSGLDLLDGIYNFKVQGGLWHTIVISKNGQSYDETGTFVSGAAYRFTI